ncbi:hypothetical protein [Phytohabitans rumicis]|uniref:Recombinase A n=1 Tax=Phytohabitans rumicis TaxID=1076125 RepID=A0A6V8L3D0_9ACTN|nr:hypothetical protein [Phytohabitans rumicis]GFJ88646.1 hypothetical protein Prum_022880 [Phytohabitans rumicis]
MAGLATLRSAAVTGLVRPASDPESTGRHRVLPVLPELGVLLPGGGLRRGTTIAVVATPPVAALGPAPSGLRSEATREDGASQAPGPARAERAPANSAGGSSLVLALIAEASRAGSWCALVGIPTFGALAAADAGIALDRLAVVPNPGPEWAAVVAALIDGLDVVVAAVPGTVSATVAGRLAARARQRGSVLVPYGRWEGADVTLQVTRSVWEGLEQGRGRLRQRRVTIVARGRGAAARPKEITVWMPGSGGRPVVAIVDLEPPSRTTARRATLTLLRQVS